jgi:SAM-dependent methyltransferase
VARADRERWDRRWAEGSHPEETPPAWIEEASDPVALPRSGRALDVASGTGRVARWLARRGLEVLAVDVSPVALEGLRARAAAEGLPVETRALDLEAEPPPAGPWDVITCFHYLQRDLFPALHDGLAVGGLLVVEVPTVRNLQRHPRPSRRFLVESGELRDLLDPLEIVWYREGWFEDRALARGIGRRV